MRTIKLPRSRATIPAGPSWGLAQDSGREGEYADYLETVIARIASVRETWVAECDGTDERGEWVPGDDQRIRRHRAWIAYDGDGDAIEAIWESPGLPDIETIKGALMHLRYHVEYCRSFAAGRQEVAARRAANRDRLRQTYERAISLVPVSRRTGRPRQDLVHAIEYHYEQACCGDRHHEERLLADAGATS